MFVKKQRGRLRIMNLVTETDTDYNNKKAGLVFVCISKI